MLQNEQAATTENSASTPEVSTANNSSMPDVNKLSSNDLEGMLVNKPPENTAAENTPTPEVGKPKEELPIPDKFKNPDGTPNLANLVKSYTEAEKTLGKVNNVNHENELLKQQIQDLYAEMENAKRTQEEFKSKLELPEEELTQEQLTRKIIREEMVRQEQEARKQRIADYEVLTAINLAREKLPNFREFEPEIEALAKTTNDVVKQSPKSVELLYNAVVGMKTPELVNFARQQAFKEGYEKAKSEMKMQVEGGGRDTTPVDISLNAQSVGNLSSAELEKMLPKMNDNTTRILY